HLEPTRSLFVTTDGKPIEPKTFAEHWYRCLRALGIRVRGLYCTKDTFVSLMVSNPKVPIAWIEQQTGVTYATLRKHYGKWWRPEGEDVWAAIAPQIAPQKQGSRAQFHITD